MADTYPNDDQNYDLPDPEAQDNFAEWQRQRNGVAPVQPTNQAVATPVPPPQLAPARRAQTRIIAPVRPYSPASHGMSVGRGNASPVGSFVNPVPPQESQAPQEERVFQAPAPTGGFSDTVGEVSNPSSELGPAQSDRPMGMAKAAMDRLASGQPIDRRGARALSERRAVEQQVLREGGSVDSPAFIRPSPQTGAPEVANQPLGSRGRTIEDQFNASTARKAGESRQIEQWKTNGIKYFRTPDGVLQPLRDESGSLQYELGDWQQRQLANGELALQRRGVSGRPETRRVPMSTNPNDPTDPNLYQDFGIHGGLTPMGHVEDLAKSSNVNVAAAATKHLSKIRQLARGEAMKPLDDQINGLEQEKAAADAQKAQADGQIDALAKSKTALGQQEAALRAAGQWEQGGVFGIGASLTPQAQAVKAAQAKAGSDTEAFTQAGTTAMAPWSNKQDERGGKESQLQALKAEKNLWTLTSKSKAYADLADERISVLRKLGKPTDGDPILAQIGDIQAKYQLHAAQAEQQTNPQAQSQPQQQQAGVPTAPVDGANDGQATASASSVATPSSITNLYRQMKSAENVAGMDTSSDALKVASSQKAQAIRQQIDSGMAALDPASRQKVVDATRDPTLAEKAKQFGLNTVSAAGSSLMDIPQFAVRQAARTANLFGAKINPDENSAKDYMDAMQTVAHGWGDGLNLPTNVKQKLDESWMVNDVAKGVGSLAGMVGPGEVVSGLAKLSKLTAGLADVAKLATNLGAGGAATANSLRDEVIAANAPRKQALDAQLAAKTITPEDYGHAVNALQSQATAAEAIGGVFGLGLGAIGPLGNSIGGMMKVPAGKMFARAFLTTAAKDPAALTGFMATTGKVLLDKTVNALGEGASMAVINSLTTLGENAAAKGNVPGVDAWDANRSATKGLDASAVSGIITGTLIRGFHEAAARNGITPPASGDENAGNAQTPPPPAPPANPNEIKRGTPPPPVAPPASGKVATDGTIPASAVPPVRPEDLAPKTTSEGVPVDDELFNELNQAPAPIGEQPAPKAPAESPSPSAVEPAQAQSEVRDNSQAGQPEPSVEAENITREPAGEAGSAPSLESGATSGMSPADNTETKTGEAPAPISDVPADAGASGQPVTEPSQEAAPANLSSPATDKVADATAKVAQAEPAPVTPEVTPVTPEVPANEVPSTPPAFDMSTKEGRLANLQAKAKAARERKAELKANPRIEPTGEVAKGILAGNAEAFDAEDEARRNAPLDPDAVGGTNNPLDRSGVQETMPIADEPKTRPLRNSIHAELDRLESEAAKLDAQPLGTDAENNAAWDRRDQIAERQKELSGVLGELEKGEIDQMKAAQKVNAIRARKPKPLNMAGESRPDPVKKQAVPAPEFTAIHPKSQEKFNAAWDGKSVEGMQALLHPMNKGMRAEWERRTGEKLPAGVKATDDAIKARFEKATPKVADTQKSTERESLADKPTDRIDFERLKELGFTNNFREAGYMTPDGKLIDLSGKKEGGQPNTRSYDHREAGGTSGMMELQNLGYIRMQPESGGMDIVQKPTYEQEGVIRRYVEHNNGAVIIDLQDGIGKWTESGMMGSAYSGASRKSYLEFPEGTKAIKVLGMIRRFYAGEDVGGKQFSLGEKSTSSQGIPTAEAESALADWRKANPSAPDNIRVVNDASMVRNGRGVRGLYQGGRLTINAAHLNSAEEVHAVLNHEWAHDTLATPKGKLALAAFAGREIPTADMAALAEKYTKRDGENALDHRLRLVDEWVAANAEKKPTVWRKIVDAVRGFLNRAGLVTLTNEEAARAMLRTLRKGEASDYQLPSLDAAQQGQARASLADEKKKGDVNAPGHSARLAEAAKIQERFDAEEKASQKEREDAVSVDDMDDEDHPGSVAVSHPDSGTWIVYPSGDKWYAESDQGSRRPLRNSKADAIDDAKDEILNEVGPARGTFGNNELQANASSELFGIFKLPEGASQTGWETSKWGSWYNKVTLDDESDNPITLKLSVRDHEATRVDMGHNDITAMVSKEWSPAEVASALDRVEMRVLKKAGQAPDARESLADKQPKDEEDAQGVLSKAKDAVVAAVKDVAALPKFEGQNRVVNEWVGRNQSAIAETERRVKILQREFKDKDTRVAVSNWIDMKGDRAAIENAAKTAKKDSLRKGYEDALKLTPEQIQKVQSVKALYDADFKKAVDAGVIDDDKYREDYVTHLVKKAFVGGGPASQWGGKLVSKFKYGKERVFPNFNDLEQAGYDTITKDIAETYATYAMQLNKSINTRNLARDLLTTKGKDGQPLGKLINGQMVMAKKNDANFIENPTGAEQHPNVEPFGENTYKGINQPAFTRYQWMGKTLEGKDVLMQGEIGVHPDAHSQISNMLERSALRNWYDAPGTPVENLAKMAVKAFDKAQSMVKSTMLGGISTFHAVHEMKRAAGNLVNPFTLKEIDPHDPEQARLIRAGMMVKGDRDVQNMFSEGLGGNSLVDKIPGVGKLSRFVSDVTFHRLIPALKMQTGLALYKRNIETFKSEIESGKAHPDDVAYLTAQQVNARFGHLNLADLNRNPTYQHLLSMAALAPDFWESNIRNYGQAAKGLLGAKSGRQPALAFAVTASTLWLVSRVLNKALDDDYHFDEPFGVIHDGRKYTMRNEAEDLWRMTHQPAQYISGRLNPVLASVDEWRTGRNWRGEKVSTADVVKELATKGIPISAKAIPPFRQLAELSGTGANRTVSPLQEFMSSQGVSVSRVSPVNEAYKLATAYKKEKGVPEDTGTYPVSKYQQLRYALEDGDESRAKEQIQKLAGTEPLHKLKEGFHASMFRPWTGDKAMDKDFMKSLSEEDKAKVSKAEAKKEDMFRQFSRILISTPRQAAAATAAK